ncbi:MAG: hypothetical protein DSZ10_03140, partial [Sulfurovum sp.]
SHYQIFIDTDGTPTTGYSRGSIRGVEYLVEDGHLYRYPDGATGWHWGDAIRSDISTDATSTQLTVKVPLASIEMNDYIIDYAAMVLSPDWQHGHEFVSHGALDTLQNPNDNNGQVSVAYREAPKALRNPLKGFMGWNTDIVSTPYFSMYKGIVHWNDIENRESDGVEKIIDYSNRKLFRGNYRGKSGVRVEESNMKVNPEVIVQKESSTSFMPSDMDISEHNNQTDAFARRVRKLVEKLGKAWDNDPRVGFVYMGIVGTWGEQWSTPIAPNVQKALGESFEKAFKHKKVMVRLPHYFHEKYLKEHNNRARPNWDFPSREYTEYFNHFGMYWDAFAQDGLDGHGGEAYGNLDTINVLKQIQVWREQPILGEVAYNMSYSQLPDRIEYGVRDDSMDQFLIDKTLQKERSLEYLKDYIFLTHATGLSWIDRYNHNNPDEARAASILQKSMGYRFFIPNATYTKKVGDDKKLHLKFAVKNLGSAPFYYRWPLEVSLLDPQTKEPIWHQKVDQTDIRKWLPGDDWDMQSNRYRIPAQTYTVETDFTLPQSLEEGEYILAVAILDPAGDKPSVRFANTNYYKNGRTPLGMVGVGVDPQGTLPAFDEIGGDPGLRYNIANEDGSGTNTQNTIDSLDAESDQEMLALNAHGHFAQDAHIIFFIDADNDPNTGYTRGDIIGADYLIQSNGLYRYPDGAHGWKWTKVANGGVTRVHDGIATVKMPLSMIDADTVNFTAQVSSHDWKHNTVYPEMISYQVPQDANTISSIEASHSKSSLHLKMNGSFIKGSHASFFIDADNDMQTGYSNGSVKGAEYLVEDHSLYRYPDNAKGWKWDKVGAVETVFSSTAIISSIPLNMLDIGTDINYISGITTADWKTNVKFPHMQKYTLNTDSVTFTPEQRLMADQIISVFENGTTELQYAYIEDIHDNRGYTAGVAGFTSGTGDMLVLIEKYTQIKPHNVLSKYIPELKRLDKIYAQNDYEPSEESANIENLKGLVGDWKIAAKDSVFRNLQDDIRSTLYFKPSLKIAHQYGIRYPLTLLCVYDAVVQHGIDGVVDDILKHIDVPSPKEGGDEIAWLEAFNAQREYLISNFEDEEKTYYRVHALNDIIKQENYDLKPFTLVIKDWDNESFKIPSHAKSKTKL